MSKSFKQTLIDIAGTELESKGFELASVTCYHGYPIYHRKSDSYIEIIQFGRDRYQPRLIVSCSIVYLNVDEEKSNIHYPSFREFSGGDLAKICVDDCKDKFFLKGHLGRCFYFGDIYLAFGRGIVGVSEGQKKPFGIKIKKHTPKTQKHVATLILKRLESAYIWLSQKRAEQHAIPYEKIVEIMNDKNLDFGNNKYAHTVIYSKAHDKRYVIIYDKANEIFTYSLEYIRPFDEEEWCYISHHHDALPAEWSVMKEPMASIFGTFDEVMTEIKSEQTYKEYFV